MVCRPKFPSYSWIFILDCWDRLYTGYVLRVELSVQRRLYLIFVRDVGSPGIYERFRWLTGSQRTPGNWGVTNTIGRLERSGAQQEQSYELSIHGGQMEPPLEEHQSQQGVHRNPNAYRSMRDHIHPPRVSAPSCIVPHSKDITRKPYIVPLLPTFYGMESENPYSNIREFEEVCNTFKENISNVDLMRLKFFPLTLKD